MFSSIFRLLLPKDPLLAAIDQGDARLVEYTLLHRKLTLLAYPQEDGLESSLLARGKGGLGIERHAMQIAGTDSLQPMAVDHRGRPALLAFTRARYAAAYCKRLVTAIARDVVLPRCEVSGVVLLELLSPQTDVLLNAGSRDQRVVSGTMFEWDASDMGSTELRSDDT